MTPTDARGTQFLTEPLATRSGDTFRMMASSDDTSVEVDGSSVATPNTDQVYETILSSASTITANNPIQVMQYSNGESTTTRNADPFDITIPPTAQFLNSYTIATETKPNRPGHNSELSLNRRSDLGNGERCVRWNGPSLERLHPNRRIVVLRGPGAGRFRFPHLNRGFAFRTHDVRLRRI